MDVDGGGGPRKDRGGAGGSAGGAGVAVAAAGERCFQREIVLQAEAEIADASGAGADGAERLTSVAAGAQRGTDAAAVTRTPRDRDRNAGDTQSSLQDGDGRTNNERSPPTSSLRGAYLDERFDSEQEGPSVPRQGEPAAPLLRNAGARSGPLQPLQPLQPREQGTPRASSGSSASAPAQAAAGGAGAGTEGDETNAQASAGGAGAGTEGDETNAQAAAGGAGAGTEGDETNATVIDGEASPSQRNAIVTSQTFTLRFPSSEVGFGVRTMRASNRAVVYCIHDIDASGPGGSILLEHDTVVKINGIEVWKFISNFDVLEYRSTVLSSLLRGMTSPVEVTFVRFGSAVSFSGVNQTAAAEPRRRVHHEGEFCIGRHVEVNINNWDREDVGTVVEHVLGPHNEKQYRIQFRHFHNRRDVVVNESFLGFRQGTRMRCFPDFPTAPPAVPFHEHETRRYADNRPEGRTPMTNLPTPVVPMRKHEPKWMRGAKVYTSPPYNDAEELNFALILEQVNPQSLAEYQNLRTSGSLQYHHGEIIAGNWTDGLIPPGEDQPWIHGTEEFGGMTYTCVESDRALCFRHGCNNNEISCSAEICLEWDEVDQDHCLRIHGTHNASCVVRALTRSERFSTAAKDAVNKALLHTRGRVYSRELVRLTPSCLHDRTEGQFTSPLKSGLLMCMILSRLGETTSTPTRLPRSKRQSGMAT